MTGRVAVEPFSRAVSVTPSDTTLIAPSRGIMASGGTELAIAFQDGSTVILTNITPGYIYPVSVVKVLATGTTATDIIAFY